MDFKPITPERASQIYAGNTYRFYEECMLPQYDKNNDSILDAEELESGFFNDYSSYVDDKEYLKAKGLEDEFVMHTISDSIMNIYNNEESYMTKDNFSINADSEEEFEEIYEEINDAISFYSSQFPNLEKYFDSINTYYFSNSYDQEEVEKGAVPASLKFASKKAANSIGAYSYTEDRILIKTPLEDFEGPDTEYNQNFKYGENEGVSDSFALRITLGHELGHSLDFATTDENGNVVFDPDKKDVNFAGFSESELFSSTFKEECDSLGLSDKSYIEILGLKGKQWRGAHSRDNVAYAVSNGNVEAFACMVETILNSDYKYAQTINNNFPKTLKVVREFLESIE